MKAFCGSLESLDRDKPEVVFKQESDMMSFISNMSLRILIHNFLKLSSIPKLSLLHQS